MRLIMRVSVPTGRVSYAACVCITFLCPVARGLHSAQCFESSVQRRPKSSTLDGKPETVTRPGHSIVILFKILPYVFVGKSPLFLYNYYVYAYLIINQSKIIFIHFYVLFLVISSQSTCILLHVRVHVIIVYAIKQK